MFRPFLKFICDLCDIENEVLSQATDKVIVFIDYYCEWNPNYRNV